MPSDSLILGLDAQVNFALALLGKRRPEKGLTDGSSPSPGVFFSIDPVSKVVGTFETGRNSLISLDYKVHKEPRWIALHFVVGGVDLRNSSLLGVVVKCRAPEPSTFRVGMRSALSAGFQDDFFSKQVIAISQPTTHFDTMTIDENVSVPTRADWRELILFFQNSSARFDLIDLRFFIV